MKKLIILLLIVSACFPAFAGTADVIDLKSGFYESIDELALLCGYSRPNQARPWTVAQAGIELGRIDCPQEFSEKYSELDSYLRQMEEDSFKVSLDITPQMYFHTNGEDFNREQDWVYGFSERESFAKAKLDASIDSFATYCELAYGWGKTTYKDTFIAWKDYVESTGRTWRGIGAVLPEAQGSVKTIQKSYLYSKDFLFNFPKIDCLEIEIPRRTYISFAGKSFSLRFSRDRLAWGVSELGNFIFDAANERNAYLNLNVSNGKYGFDYVSSFLAERTDDAVEYENTGSHRIFMAHRLFYRFGKAVQLAVSENIMYRFSNINPETLNPSYIYHQLNNAKQLNAIALLELDITACKGFNLWSQFVVDQAKIPTEFHDEDSAFGAMLGMQYVLSSKAGIFDFSAEAAYASPALYRRDMVDFITVNRYSTNIEYRHIPFYSYIGFPYGGDTIAFYADAQWKTLSGLCVKLSGKYAANGGFTMYDCHSNSGTNTGTPDLHLGFDNGNITYTADIGLEFEYDFELLTFPVKAQGGIWEVLSNGKKDLQSYLGLGITI